VLSTRLSGRHHSMIEDASSFWASSAIIVLKPEQRASTATRRGLASAGTIGKAVKGAG